MALYRCPVYSQLFLISGEGFSLSNFFSRPFFFLVFFLCSFYQRVSFTTHISGIRCSSSSIYVLLNNKSTFFSFVFSLHFVSHRPSSESLKRNEFFQKWKTGRESEKGQNGAGPTTYWMGGCSTVTILSHFSQVLRFEPANFQILPITTNEHSVTSQLYFFFGWVEISIYSLTFSLYNRGTQSRALTMIKTFGAQLVSVITLHTKKVSTKKTWNLDKAQKMCVTQCYAKESQTELRSSLNPIFLSIVLSK